MIDEQIAYYRARAAEYDDWWLRRGEFDLGADFAGAWASDVDAVRRGCGPRRSATTSWSWPPGAATGPPSCSASPAR